LPARTRVGAISESSASSQASVSESRQRRSLVHGPGCPCRSGSRPSGGISDRDPFEISDALEADGVVYLGRHKDIDSAICLGLRRYGVRKVNYMDQFHVLKCSLNGADGHWYTARVTVRPNTYHYTVSRDF
jgi:hypothetical protein